MPKQLQKSLSDYLTKKKKKPTPQQTTNSANKNLSSSTSWLLHGCRHPKTPSFSAVDRKEKNVQGENNAATLADVDRFVFENFKSFYHKDDDIEAEANTSILKKGKKKEIAGRPNSLSESPRYDTFWVYLTKHVKILLITNNSEIKKIIVYYLIW